VAGAEALAETIAASSGIPPSTVSGILDFAQVRAKIALAAGRQDEARAQLDALLVRARATGHVNVAEETEALMKAGAPTPAPEPAQEAAPELLIRTFGGLRAARADGAISDKEWQTARAKQLLAFLVFTPEGATKETLLEHVFPNEAVSNDLMNMTMMRVRKALEPGLEKGQPSRFILRADGRYQLNREAHVAVDVDGFEAALRDARGPAEREGLERALAAYSGTFLPEIEAPWAVAIRLRLQDQAVGACRRLLAIYDEAAPERADALLARALEIDPLNEELNREIILRHLESGEGQRALAHFQLADARWRQLAGQPAPPDLAALVGAT
jgi:two-component SAPR family response regulator